MKLTDRIYGFEGLFRILMCDVLTFISLKAKHDGIFHWAVVILLRNEFTISSLSLTEVAHGVAALDRAPPSLNRGQTVDAVPDRRQDGGRLTLLLNDARRNDDVGVGVGVRVGELLARHVTTLPDAAS